MKQVTASSSTEGLTRFVVKLAAGDVLRDKAGRVRSFPDVVSAQSHAKPGDRVMIRAAAGV